jgi:hypothetical protein
VLVTTGPTGWMTRLTPCEFVEFGSDFSLKSSQAAVKLT